jgi:hypothetical protein
MPVKFNPRFRFRAWRIDKHLDGSPHYVPYLIMFGHKEGVRDVFWHRVRKGIKKNKPEETHIPYHVPFMDTKEWVVEQSSGFVDRNLNEIYEGDILASRGNYFDPDGFLVNGMNPDFNVQVVWNPDECMLGVTDNPKTKKLWVCNIDTFREIVGHRFRNPGLKLGYTS